MSRVVGIGAARRWLHRHRRPFVGIGEAEIRVSLWRVRKTRVRIGSGALNQPTDKRGPCAFRPNTNVRLGLSAQYHYNISIPRFLALSKPFLPLLLPSELVWFLTVKDRLCWEFILINSMRFS